MVDRSRSYKDELHGESAICIVGKFSHGWPLLEEMLSQKSICDLILIKL